MKKRVISLVYRYATKQYAKDKDHKKELWEHLRFRKSVGAAWVFLMAEVDSSIESAQAIAAKIKAYNQRVPWPQAFQRIRNEKIAIRHEAKAPTGQVLST